MIEYENLQKSNQPFIEEYLHSFKAVNESGRYILGQEVQKFESSFAEYCGSKYCIGVANGLDALTVALKIFKFKEGSEVIVPSNTYIATILSILNCGLKPVLVEPRISTYNINPDLIEESITSRTRAIMIVHLYGKCCEIDPIIQLAKKYNLRIIEDCAHAHGAMYKNSRAGTLGDFGAFSFYPTKNLGALGDAGSLNTNEYELAEQVRIYRNYGSGKKYYNEVIGVNSRLDELQAAFLNVKLRYLDKINSHKRKLAAIYFKELKDDFIKPSLHPDYFDVYHIFSIRHNKRDDLKLYLEKNEIKTDIHYPIPPHKQKAMSGIFDQTSYPVSEEIHATTLSLPISYFHTEDDIYKITELLNRY